MSKMLWYGLILVESACIVALILCIKTKAAPHAFVSPVHAESVVFVPTELKFFYEPRPNYVDTTMSPGITEPFVTTINAAGFVATHEYTLQKPPHTYRIETLGDSFTYGVYVSTEENYSSNLERMLNERLVCKQYGHFEVLNMGVRGYDVAYAAHRFLTLGIQYEPDALLWFIKPDDIKYPSEDIIQKYQELSFANKDANDAAPKADAELYILASTKVDKEIPIEKRIRYAHDWLTRVAIAFTKPILIHHYAIDRHWVMLDSLAKEYPHVRYHVDEKKLTNPNIFPDTHPNRAGHTLIAEDLFAQVILLLPPGECEQKV